MNLTPEQESWIRLAFSENVGPVTFFQLLAYFGSAQKALANLPDFAKKIGGKKDLHVLDEEAYQHALNLMDTLGIQVLFKGQAGYPQKLLPFDDAPPVLFARGKTDLLHQNAIAIVGTRTASINGQHFAQHLADRLAQKGYVIISGLAKGIDTAAHTGALQKGQTIAVLGTALDQYYPLENKALQEKIAQEGLLLSEVLPGKNGSKFNFPIRNRLISGLSVGVVVAEAGTKSGALRTAHFAVEQGKEVFAVPGFPLDPKYQGTNELIKQGATLVMSADDITDALRQAEQPIFTESIRPTPVSFPVFSDDDLKKAQQKILSALTATPTHIDMLIQETGCPPPLIQIALTGLELADKVLRVSGNQILRLYDGEKE